MELLTATLAWMALFLFVGAVLYIVGIGVYLLHCIQAQKPSQMRPVFWAVLYGCLTYVITCIIWQFR
jgi:hypothetical protein